MSFYVCASDEVLGEIAEIESSAIQHGLEVGSLSLDDLDAIAEQILHRLSHT
jgi:hypothetical protein